MKTCTKCERPFWARGLCVMHYRRAWRLGCIPPKVRRIGRDPEKTKVNNANYHAAHRVKENQRSRKWNQDNREHATALNRKWCKANPEKRNASNRKSNHANPITTRARQFRQKARYRIKRYLVPAYVGVEEIPAEILSLAMAYRALNQAIWRKRNGNGSN